MKMLAIRTLAGVVLAVVAAGCQTGTPLKVAVTAAPVPRQVSSDEPPLRELERTVEYVFDDAGQYTRTQLRRYRVLTAAGVDEASDFEVEWQPWYMARPEVSVRVMDPRGGVHPVEAASFVESQVAQSSPGVLSDARVLRAPLPGLEVGSTVEERVVWKATKPYPPAGAVRSFPFGGPIPMDAVRLVLDAPESLPLRHRLLDAVVSVKEERGNGRRRVTFSGGPYAPIAPLEPLQIPEVALWPQVAFSTGKSWQDVARGYNAMVDRALEGSDLVATVRTIAPSSESPRTKAEKLLAWARSRVRYADVELGAASYEPEKPLETLRRGYGDCKDQAVLLTGLLRAAGLDAHVALVRSGSSEDVREDLPGLGSFDHAIVAVDGKEPFFMDPTATFYPAGVLPAAEQGRLTLIVSDATTGLSRMPARVAAANTYTEEREIYFADVSDGRVTETTTATGGMEASLRSSYAGTRESLQPSVDKYAKDEYGAAVATKADFGSMNDLGKPIRIRFDIGQASRVFTGLGDAAVALQTNALFTPLPKAILGTKPRLTAAQLPSAFQSEIRYRIVPPKGFALAELPRFESVDMGPGKLSRNAVQNADGSLSAVFRFEMPKVRLEPKEVEALRAGVQALDAQAVVTVRFMHEGAKLLAEGKLREGMDAYRRFLGTPAGHIRFSTALLEAGFVEPARREARRAVELAPNMSLAHQHLGYVAMHDALGRDFRPGYDRETVIAESRKALVLDATNLSAQVNLALGLERDASGAVSKDPADVRKAIERYDAIDPARIADIGGTDYSNNALFLLMQMGRYDDMLRRLAKRSSDQNVNALRVTAVAGTRGASAAIDEVVRLGLNDEARAQMLASAAWYLYKGRRYPDAAALYEVAARTGKEAAAYQQSAKLMRQLRRYETLTLSEKDPEEFVKLAAIRFLVGKGDEALYAAASGLSSAEIQANIRAYRAEFARNTSEFTVEVLLDILLSTSKMRHETYGIADIVHSEIGSAQSEFIVVREGGVYRLVSFEQNPAQGICAGALHALAEQKDADARRWLDLGKKLITPAYAPDELDTPLLARAWGRGGDVRAATACLCAAYSDARHLVSLLLESRDRVKDAEQQHAVDQALTFVAMRADDRPRALEAADRLLAALPNSTTAVRTRLDVLHWLNRQDELRSALKKELTRAPGDAYLLAMKARLEDRTGHSDDAAKSWRKVLDSGHATSMDYNNAAWSTLFRGKPTEQADLDLALQAVQMSNNTNVYALHTLATLYADAGRTNEARQTLQLIVDKHESRTLDPKDYLVLGRIAEAYGLDDVAREAYERVTKSPGDLLASSWDLAQRRRSMLGKAVARR